MVRIPSHNRGNQNNYQMSSQRKGRVANTIIVEEEEKQALKKPHSLLQSSPSVTSLLTINDSVSHQSSTPTHCNLLC